LPKIIEPINEHNELELLSELMLELNTKFMSDLGELTREDTGLEDKDTAEDNRHYIVIGGSHAGRLADSLDDMGLHVADLSVPGWSVCERNVEKAVAELQKELSGVGDTPVVLIFCTYWTTTCSSVLRKMGPDPSL
jgi:hypothetical protein